MLEVFRVMDYDEYVVSCYGGRCFSLPPLPPQFLFPFFSFFLSLSRLLLDLVFFSTSFLVRSRDTVREFSRNRVEFRRDSCFSNRVFSQRATRSTVVHLAAGEKNRGGRGRETRRGGENGSDERALCELIRWKSLNRYPGRSSASRACCK